MVSSLADAVCDAAGSARRLPCADALALAESLQVEPRAIGAAADAAGVKIVRCELGLFGPRRLDDPEGGEPHRSSGVRERLSSLPSLELACAAAWAIAHDHGVEPLVVGRAASRLSIRLHQCQLGCF